MVIVTQKSTTVTESYCTARLFDLLFANDIDLCPPKVKADNEEGRDMPGNSGLGCAGVRF